MSSVRSSFLEITIRLTPGCLGANPSAYNKYIIHIYIHLKYQRMHLVFKIP